MNSLPISKYNHAQADYISVSDLAAEKILESLLAHKEELTNNPDEKLLHEKICGIKLSLPTKGCGGFSYDIEFAYNGLNVDEEDDVINLKNGACIFIDPKKSFLLTGLLLDYEDNGIEFGFKFVNPNESGKCGCGSSFFV